MRHLVKEVADQNHFTEEQWQQIISAITRTWKLNREEIEMLHNSKPAKVLAAMPFIAGCKNPDLLAILKLVMYLTGKRSGKLFAQRDNQTIKERIQIGTQCPDGDPGVIQFAQTLLEYYSLQDHYHDLETDAEQGHANPILDQKIKYFPTNRILKEKLLGADISIYQRFQRLFKTDLLISNWW